MTFEFSLFAPHCNGNVNNFCSGLIKCSWLSFVTTQVYSTCTVPQLASWGNQGSDFLLLDFLAFCFVQPAQAHLNSTPQLVARDRHAIAQGAQFGPGDLRMDAAA